MKNLRLLSILIALIFCFAVVGINAADEKAPPDDIMFSTKNGDVNFPHAKHIELAKKDCKTCHDKLFPQDKTAALDYKAGMHKKAEKAATSCGACHHAEGTAFESKGNCTKCHAKKK